MYEMTSLGGTYPEVQFSMTQQHISGSISWMDYSLRPQVGRYLSRKSQPQQKHRTYEFQRATNIGFCVHILFKINQIKKQQLIIGRLYKLLFIRCCVNVRLKKIPNYSTFLNDTSNYNKMKSKGKHRVISYIDFYFSVKFCTKFNLFKN